jgi:hypothetical protein
MKTRKRRGKQRAKRPVRQHSVVEADLRVPQLSKAGASLSLTVYARGRKLGEITVGRGSLFWRGGYRHREQSTKRVPWSRFAAAMNRLAYGE